MSDHDSYLKTRQVANALGVSVSTVKRWVDKGMIRATRTMGKHRLVSLAAALEFARQENLHVKPLVKVSNPAPQIVVDDDLVKRFILALRQGSVTDVRDIVSMVCRSELGSVALADLLIRPTMERIGHSWLVGAWDTYQEHQATLMVASAVIEQIRELTPDDDSSLPLAIGAAPSGDPYVLPTLLGELVLREQGWRVINLSNNLPLKSLAKATRDHNPRIVFLSINAVSDRDAFVAEYSYFYEAASQAGAAIVVGGRGLDPDLRSRLVYASFGERMAHLFLPLVLLTSSLGLKFNKREEKASA